MIKVGSILLKTRYWLMVVFAIKFFQVQAGVLEVGPGKAYSSPAQAAQVAIPGDTILIFPNIYTGNQYIFNLHGTAGQPIVFMGTDVNQVIFSGGLQGMHLSQVSYIELHHLSFTQHTGNGLNIDDAGTFDTPSHHIRIIHCRFYEMGAQGNNDFLKLSGIDHFEVVNCTFSQGAAGGSGIDMVGCHHGIIHKNEFHTMGSNSIQAKGGTQFIAIFQNRFEDGGQRTLNLGGSTGLAYFRPQDAPFEAADLDVYANVFIRSWAPIAYVGSVRVRVTNNTLVDPQNWVIRILQETVDPERFLPCGDNEFVNNIIYYNYTRNISTHVNIGPNTDPQSFTFSNNLWYNHNNLLQSAPNLPVIEPNGIYGLTPEFIHLANGNFRLNSSSPAINSGHESEFAIDFDGFFRPDGMATDIGAFEYLNTPEMIEINGNQWVCLTCLNQHYQAMSSYGHHFLWNVEGGIIQGVNSDSMVAIEWDAESAEHMLEVTPFSINGVAGDPIFILIQLQEEGLVQWIGEDPSWLNRKNWLPATLPQGCHTVIIDDSGQYEHPVIPSDAVIYIKRLEIRNNKTLLIQSGGVLEITGKE